MWLAWSRGALVTALVGCVLLGGCGSGSSPGASVPAVLAPTPGAPAPGGERAFDSPSLLAALAPAPAPIPPPGPAPSTASPPPPAAAVPLPPAAPTAPAGPGPVTSLDVLAAFAEQNVSTLAPVATPATTAQIASARIAGGPEAGFTLCGRVHRVVRNNPGDVATGGYLVVGDTTVVVPRNLIVDFTVVRLTLEEIFEQAPEPFHSKGLSGIALEDGPPSNDWQATVLANRFGSILIAGKITLVKRAQVIEGVVTFIDHSRSELRLNGDARGTTGTRVRLNDPSGKYAGLQPSCVQTGPGKGGSPDLRCQTDPENAIVTAATGYPMRIPSVDPASGDDPLAPSANRNQAVDSKLGGLDPFFASAPLLQAPILVGDHVVASGTFELDPGPDQVFGTQDDVRFLAADTLDDFCWIFTSPGDPCYVRVHDATWIAPPFPLRRAELRVRGFCTDLTTTLELQIVRRDPTNASEFLEPFGTANVLPFGHFAFVFSVDLGGGGAVFAPDPGADLLTLARDLRVAAGNQTGVTPGAPFLNRGGFTTPVTILFPEPEVNRRQLGQPWEFRNIPWLVDGDGTARAPGALDPWPGLETRPDARTKTVRSGHLVSRASVGLPTLP